MKSRIPFILLVFTLLASITLHWKIFSTDLIGVHLWRQIQNQWNIRNFYREDNNILNPRIAAHNLGHEGNILRYEFPMMQWSIAQVQRVLGESIAVTRGFLFLSGFFGVIGFYTLILLLFRERILAALGAWMLNFSPIFYYYTVNPMSDIPAMAAQIWMLVFAVKFYRQKELKLLVWSGLFFGLAGLFKLPYALFGLVPLTAAGLIYWNKERPTSFFIESLLILLAFSLPVAAWYSYAIRDWESMGVLKGIFGMEDKTDLFRIIKFHVFNWLPGYLVQPAGLVFLIWGLISLLWKKPKFTGLIILLGAGILASLGYYIYELNMISTVHDYYMLPFLPGLYILVVYGLSLVPDRMVFKILTLMLLLAMPVWTYTKINAHFWHIDRNGFNADWFNFSESLKQAAPNDSLCIFLNDNSGVVFPYEADKQGYVFDKDELPAIWMADMIINRRASYMYSDSRKIDTSAEIRPFLDQLVLEAGTVRVFRLVSRQSVSR